MRPFDAAGGFATAAMPSVRRTAVRGAGVTIAAAGASLVVQLGATMVLARILTPADFGIVAMVTTFSLLLGSFGLAGFTEAILQRKDVTHQLASNLFWISIAGTTLLAAVLAVAGPALNRLYHNPLVANVAEGMALSVFAYGFSVVHLALLQRGLRFGTASAIRTIGRAAMAVTAIALAVAGWGYWALVAGYVAQPCAVAIGGWLACPWLPGLPAAEPGTLESVKFGFSVYARYGLNYGTNNTDNLLVGWRFNATALGFYKKAYDLFLLPSSQLLAPIWSVVVATLSRLREDQREFQRYLLSGMGVLAFVGMGIAGDFTLIGGDVVRFILGPGWEETGRIFRLFAPGIGIMLLYSAQAWIHVTIGRPDRWLRWGVVEFVVTAGFFILALPLGPRGIALAWTVSYALLLLPGFWYAGRPVGFGLGPVIYVVWRYFAASAIAAGVGFWVIARAALFASSAGAAGALARAAWGSVIFFMLYAGALVVLSRGLGPFRQVLDLLRELLPAGSVAAERRALAASIAPEK